MLAPANGVQWRDGANQTLQLDSTRVGGASATAFLKCTNPLRPSPSIKPPPVLVLARCVRRQQVKSGNVPLSTPGTKRAAQAGAALQRQASAVDSGQTGWGWNGLIPGARGVSGGWCFPLNTTGGISRKRKRELFASWRRLALLRLR